MKLSKDDKRNLHVLITACVLNFAFAMEKLFIIIGHQQSDWVWFFVYGGIASYLAIVAGHDYLNDIKEHNNSNSNAII